MLLLRLLGRLVDLVEVGVAVVDLALLVLREERGVAGLLLLVGGRRVRGLGLAGAADLAEGLLEVGVFLRGARGVRLLFDRLAAFGRRRLRESPPRRLRRPASAGAGVPGTSAGLADVGVSGSTQASFLIRPRGRGRLVHRGACRAAPGLRAGDRAGRDGFGQRGEEACQGELRRPAGRIRGGRPSSLPDTGRPAAR